MMLNRGQLRYCAFLTILLLYSNNKAAAQVIGVLIQLIPYDTDPAPGLQNPQNSGYAIAASMDSVLELVEGFE